MKVRIWFAPTVELLCLFLSLALSAFAAPRWNVQYLYDRAGANFAIEDLQCPTARHCVAAGWIDDKKGHEQGAVLVSSDAGLHWSQYDIKERPLSLFFLNDGQGWMVTDRGLWSTQEGGRAWTKLHTSKGILQAWFLDSERGYVSGVKGLVEHTSDGGKTWAKLEEADKLPNAPLLNFDIIRFLGDHGIILGVRDSSAPDLEDKAASVQQKVAVLETLDGGQTWNAGAINVEGDLAQLRISQRGYIVTLILYSNPKYPVGSALYLAELKSRQGHVIFAERDRVATDVALLDNGGAILATVEPPGNAAQAPIPGKLKMFESSDLKVWQEMDVDYRVVAQRAVIAAPDERNIWVATDTGAILKLDRGNR